MGRLKDLRKIIDEKLMAIDESKRFSAVNHLYGVSLAAALIAKKRGLDHELACMAAMLHDMHAYLSGSYEDHAHKGASLAKEILAQLNQTTEEETEIICSMIYHHDDKLVIDSQMDELLKDADVIHHIFNDLAKPVKEKELKRFLQLCEEFGLDPDHN